MCVSLIEEDKMAKQFVVQKPDLPGMEPEFIMIQEGQTGYYKLDRDIRHDPDYADNYNKVMGHTEQELKQALMSSFSGNW
jgi:hypothetical protein